MFMVFLHLPFIFKDCLNICPWALSQMDMCNNTQRYMTHSVCVSDYRHMLGNPDIAANVSAAVVVLPRCRSQ